jgi:hypothetical protein
MTHDKGRIQNNQPQMTYVGTPRRKRKSIFLFVVWQFFSNKVIGRNVTGYEILGVWSE